MAEKNKTKQDNIVDAVLTAKSGTTEAQGDSGNIKTLEDSVKFLRDNSEKRNFNQTFDLIINLKNMNVKKEIVNVTVNLPYSKGKDIAVGIISDDAKGENVITSKDMETIAKNKSEIKKLVKKYDYFVASAPLMITVGKLLGRYLAPAGKMPKPMPPKADPAPFVAAASKSITLKNNKQMRLQCAVGSEKSDDNQIIENVKTVIETVEKALPKGKQNIKNIMLKLTMSSPVKIQVK